MSQTALRFGIRDLLVALATVSVTLAAGCGGGGSWRRRQPGMVGNLGCRRWPARQSKPRMGRGYPLDSRGSGLYRDSVNLGRLVRFA